MRKSDRAAFVAALVLLLGGGAEAQTSVSSNITSNTTWSGVIVLENPIFVKDGATLTIDPGTIIRGQPRTAAVQAGSTVGTPGALIVTQTGQIMANGTAMNPIIMTTAAVDNDNDGVPDDDNTDGFFDAWVPGDTFYDDTPTTAPLAPLNTAGGANVSLWGGLVVLGNASTNLADECGTGSGTCTVEGLTVPGFPASDATYGGMDDADSSGSLNYISVRHAGDEIGNGNELNGVTLAGVGSGTDLSFVEVYCNFDDGIEWFGGTVNGDHLSVIFAGDDSFDVDQGYRGTNQFASAIMTYFNEGDLSNFGSSSGDKGCEWDGDDFDETPSNVNTDIDGVSDPFPNAAFWNMTIAGSDQPTTFNSHTNNNDGCEMRNGFGGELNNGIIYNTGTRQGLDLASGGAPGSTTAINAANGDIIVADVTCDDVAGVPAASPETDALANGGGNIGCESGVNDVDFGLVQEDTSFTPTGVAGKLGASLASIDLRPANTTATMTGSAPPLGLDTTATYRGAFEPAPATNWQDDWTVLSQAGMLPEPGSAPALAAGLSLLMLLKRRR